MFLGRYRHSFDDRFRLTVPTRYRELLNGGAFVIRGLDRNLMVMPPSAFDVIYQRVMSMNMADPTARLLRRLILGDAFQLEMDKAGRILIPQDLRDGADLEAEVVLVGQGDYFEVWAPTHWQAQETQTNDVETNAQRFSMLDLSTRRDG